MDAAMHDGSLTDVLKELAKAMEKANLLALDLAFRGMVESEGQENVPLDL